MKEVNEKKIGMRMCKRGVRVHRYLRQLKRGERNGQERLTSGWTERNGFQLRVSI